MLSRILIILALLALGAQDAAACQFTARPLEDEIATAKIAFVGTVRTVENGLVTFSIEKPVKGVGEGNSFDADLHARSSGSCGIDFTPGQRWLYLGNDAPSGSLLLQDEMGRPNQSSLDYIKAKVPDVGAYGADVIGGTLRAACARKGVFSYDIALDNGVSATVFADIAVLDKKEPNALAVYTAGKMEPGGANIVQCPRSRPGTVENLPCQSTPGTISIGFVTPDDATGQIKTTDGEYHSVYVFHVKRSKEKEVCG